MNWYEAAFRKDYLDLYYHRDDEAASREAAFAAEALNLPEGARVLDVGCGGGRHARALTEAGFEVVGIDLSPDLLTEAEGVIRLRADMRALPFHGSFDAATSFFTSFGYFDDSGNRATLASISAAIRPGGVFLIDYLNALAVQAHLVPASDEERDGRKFRIRRRIEAGRVLKEVEIEEEDGSTRGYVESVRLYPHSELIRLMHGAGLNPVALYGDFDGRDFTSDAPRCIVVAPRP
jgi:SAM-dependent methyltransferase